MPDESNSRPEQDSYKGYRSTGTIKIDRYTGKFNLTLSNGKNEIEGSGHTYEDAFSDATGKIDSYLKEIDCEIFFRESFVSQSTKANSPYLHLQ
ncbi:MAG: hypothetical protein R3220_09405 [Balneolaceae bacterium]|nr:hypothetical protein [Balneolaceae bacterium]